MVARDASGHRDGRPQRDSRGCRPSLSRSGSSGSSHRRRKQTLDHLEREGFIDVYRHLHPLGAAAARAGFTHFVPNPPSASRIDYLWCKGIHAASLTLARIDHAPSLHKLSHHRLLWMEMQPTHAAQAAACAGEPMRLRLPNLRAANPQHIEAFEKHLQRGVDQQQEQMQQLLACDDNPAAHLDAVASRLTAVLRRSAFACFPITGSAPYKSRDMLQLGRQRSAIARLLRLSADMLGLGSPSPPRALRALRRVEEAVRTVRRAAPRAVDPRCIRQRCSDRVDQGDSSAAQPCPHCHPQGAEADAAIPPHSTRGQPCSAGASHAGQQRAACADPCSG